MGQGIHERESFPGEAPPSRPSGGWNVFATEERGADAWLLLVRLAMHGLLLSLEAAALAELNPDVVTWRAMASRAYARFDAVRSLLSDAPEGAEIQVAAIRRTFEGLFGAHHAFAGATSTAERELRVTALLRAVDAAMQAVPTWRRSRRRQVKDSTH